MHHRGIYADSLSLLTDLYQLTMAYGYWKAGIAERQAVFTIHFGASRSLVAIPSRVVWGRLLSIWNGSVLIPATWTISRRSADQTTNHCSSPAFSNS